MLSFLRQNIRWLAGGFLLTLGSTFGQTSFISLSAGHIRGEYGLSNGGWGMVYMLATLASAFTLPTLGQVVDRYPPHRVALVVVPMLALATLVMAVSHHVALLFVSVYLLRLFGQGMMPHVAYTAAARWFSAQRGRALSLIVLGHNAGDAVLPLCFVTVAGLIGWRAGWTIAAGVLLLAALPAIAILVSKDRVPGMGEPPRRVVDARDWTRAEVIRDPLFYLAMLGIMAPGFIVTSIFFNQVYLVELRGWSLELFAAAYIITALVNSVFTLASGQLIDRFSGVAMLPYVLLPLGAACFILGFVESQWAVAAFMVCLGISNGLTTTLFGIVWPELYGLRHLGAIRSLVFSGIVFASAAGPGLTGWLIDAGVSYPAQIVAMGCYCLGVSVLLGFVSRTAIRRART